MNITNNSSNPLGLPGNSEPIKPGATVKVENWDDIKDVPAVALFLKLRVIETGGKVHDPVADEALDVSPAAQLAAINARQAAAQAPILQGDAQAAAEPEPEQEVRRTRKSKSTNEGSAEAAEE